MAYDPPPPPPADLHGRSGSANERHLAQEPAGHPAFVRPGPGVGADHGLFLRHRPLAHEHGRRVGAATSEADRSPLPSLVEYKDSSQKRGFTAGFVYRFPETMAGTSLGVQPEAGVEFTLGGAMGQVEFVGGGAALLSRGAVRLRAGARATAGYVWGKIGEVGSTPGKTLSSIAPDDERYELGSVITVLAVPLGIEPTLGAEMRVGRASVVVEATG